MKEKKSFSLNFETVGSIVAMLIGVCALFVAWDQAQVMRAQKHASVWPIVTADLTVSGDEKTRFIEFDVSNAGVGPALVRSATLIADGKEISHWSELETTLFSTEAPGAMAFNGFDIEGSVIAPGEDVVAMRGSWSAGGEIDEFFKTLAGKYLSGAAPDVQLKICYCSVFERCWETTENNGAERVKLCPAPTHFFRNLFPKEDASVQ